MLVQNVDTKLGGPGRSMRRRVVIVLALVTPLVASCSNGGQEDRMPLFEHLVIGNEQFLIGEVRLPQVAERLGMATAAIIGEGHDRDHALCYAVGSIPGDTVYVVFLSGTEMGGGEGYRYTTAVELRSSPLDELSCAVIEAPAESVTIGAALRLGMQRRELRRLLGAPDSATAMSDHFIRWMPVTEVSAGDTVRYSKGNSVVAEFAGESARVLRVYRLDVS
jgi:hypothetical protein